MTGFYKSNRYCEKCGAMFVVSHYETYDGPGSQDGSHNCHPSGAYDALVLAVHRYIDSHGWELLNRAIKSAEKEYEDL